MPPESVNIAICTKIGRLFGLLGEYHSLAGPRKAKNYRVRRIMPEVKTTNNGLGIYLSVWIKTKLSE
jgi:hypothetical protein